MTAPWRPALQLCETTTGCRLSLGGAVHGEGAVLQDAADELMRRLLHMALCIRNSGVSPAADAGAPDPRWVDFLWELGEMAARGEDIRERALGA